MAAVMLSSGAVARAKAEFTDPATLKVVEVKKLANGKIGCTFSDGTDNIPATFASQIKKALEAGTFSLREGAVCSVENYVVNKLGEQQVMIVTEMKLLQEGTGKDAAAAAAAAAASDASGSKPDQQQEAAPAAAAAAKQPPSTPAGRQLGQNTPVAAAGGARSLLTPGPTPSPSEEVRGTPLGVTPSASHTFSHTTPMSVASAARTSAAPSPIAVAERAGVQPIAALNPYNKNWCVKARVTRKGLVRTISRGGGGGETKVFSVDLVDAQGTQIEGSFWRESVDKFYDGLEEGKVYYFSNFSVKPANKQYATVRNDYQINFDARTEVCEAKDQGGISADVVQIDLVPFDKLAKHIGRKAPIDVMGVLTSVGSVGSIKRKADNSDVTRREVTLADKTGSSVVMTLWGDAATRADLREGSILQVTSVKVSDFNGCSISALMRSKVTVDPETPEAEELRSWWSSEGSTATITPLSQALGGGVSTGGPRRVRLELLSALTPAGPLPPADAKPTYHDVVATVAEVLYEEERRNILYTASPTSNKKVEERDGRWWCEGDGCYVDEPVHRYMMTVKLMDPTGEAYATVFNEQGEQLMGCPAGEAAAKQASDPAAFQRLLHGAQFGEWSVTLTARTRDYQGQPRQRISVFRLKPMDYAEEGRKLLQLIQQQTAAV